MPQRRASKENGKSASKRISKSRESLVDWVLKEQAATNTAIVPAASPQSSRPAGLAPESTAKQPKYLPLQVWANLMFGEYAPHPNTLLRWVHDGRIQPQPKKMGRHWFVKADAEYVPD